MRQAANGVRDAGKSGPVFVRAGLSIAGEAKPDQALVAIFQINRAEVPFFQCAGAEVLANNIRLSRQFAEQGLTFGVFQVEGDGFLVAAFRQPGKRTIFSFRRRAELAHGIAIAGPFHLDHVRPEFAQDAGRVGAGDEG